MEGGSDNVFEAGFGDFEIANLVILEEMGGFVVVMLLGETWIVSELSGWIEILPKDWSSLGGGWFWSKMSVA